MLTEKGQGHVTSSLGITGCGLANVQADYAVSNHIGIMANGMYHYRSNTIYTDTSTGTEKLNILFGEAGFGMFDKIGNSNSMALQCYTGAGYGKSEARIIGNYITEPSITGNFYSIFAQPGFIFKQRFIDLAVDMRFKYVKMYDIESVDFQAFEWWEDDNDFATKLDVDFMLFEPSFTFSGGSEHFRGILQTGLIIPIVNSEAYFGTSSFSFIDAPVFKFSMGICYAFGKKSEPAIK